MAEHYFSAKPTSASDPGLIKATIRGVHLELLTDAGVFSHRRLDNGTRLLAESMTVPAEGGLLDVGCGYGPLGILAGKLNPRIDVWMTDINERAVRLAEENARRNGVNARVLRGDLYEPVRDRLFDVIVSNPPVSAGMRSVVEPLVSGAVSHLKPGGLLQLVIQSNKGGKTLEAMMLEHLGSCAVTSRGGGFRVLTSAKPT